MKKVFFLAVGLLIYCNTLFGQVLSNDEISSYKMADKIQTESFNAGLSDHSQTAFDAVINRYVVTGFKEENTVMTIYPENYHYLGYSVSQGQNYQIGAYVAFAYNADKNYNLGCAGVVIDGYFTNNSVINGIYIAPTEKAAGDNDGVGYFSVGWRTGDDYHEIKKLRCDRFFDLLLGSIDSKLTIKVINDVYYVNYRGRRLGSFSKSDFSNYSDLSYTNRELIFYTHRISTWFDYLQIKDIDISTLKKQADDPGPQPNPVVVINHDPHSPDNPHPDTVSFTDFSWISPVADFSTLPDGTYHTPAASLPVKINISGNAPINLQNIQLKLNGSVVSTGGKARLVDLRTIAQKKASNSHKYIYSTTVDLQKGNNSIQLFYNNSSSDALPVVYQPESLNLYLLSIGTKAAGLQYPEKDANDFAAMFSSNSSAAKYFNGGIHTETLTGDNAKAGVIVDKVGDLAQKNFSDNDVLMIFISSHGAIIDNTYRILASDYKTTQPEKTAVDFDKEILEPLRELKCKKLIFLDACYSGKSLQNRFNGNKAPKVIDISNEIGKLVNAGDSITIITSSSGTQQSWEDDTWQNGAFTKALKEGLQEGKADTNENGIIDINELYAYIRRRVPELVKQALKTDENNTPVTQQPEIKNPIGNVSIYVY